MKTPRVKKKFIPFIWGVILMTVTLCFSQCEKEEPTREPEIELSKQSLDFGEVLVGEDSVKSFKVFNRGASTLEVEASLDMVMSITSPDFPQEIEPEDSIGVSVEFAPEEEKSYSEDLAITSNDPDEFRTEVSLQGIGVRKPGAKAWSQTFGGPNADFIKSVRQTADGGYILAGTTWSFAVGDNDGWLIKTDKQGFQQWMQTFGGSDKDQIRDVRQTQDEGFILVGYTSSSGAGKGDGWVIKTDNSGNQQWAKTFGNSEWNEFYSVEQIDGGYVLAGWTIKYSSDKDAWIMEIDQSGNMQWSNTLGGADDDESRVIQKTSSGGYILGGYTRSDGGEDADGCIAKTDGSGNLQWSKTFGEADRDRITDLRQTENEDFILVGYTHSFGAGKRDGWLIRTDNSGTKKWSKTFGYSIDDAIYTVQQTKQGFILAGSVGDGPEDFRGGEGDGWLIKTDDSGVKQWSRLFGGSKYDCIRDFQQTADAGYIMAGQTRSFGADHDDGWLIKTEED